MKRILLISLVIFALSLSAGNDKKYIYTVTWCIERTVPIPCPDANNTDAYGRKSIISCAAYHCMVVTNCDNHRTFAYREDALFFINAGKEDYNNYSAGRVTKMKLDSCFVLRQSTKVGINIPDSVYILDSVNINKWP